MNTHPFTLLAYAKYFGEAKMAISARMTGIDSNGFIVMVKNEDETEEEIEIKFKQRLKGYEEVRPVLEDMSKEAEEALGLPSTRPPSDFSTATRSPSSKNSIQNPFTGPNPIAAILIIFIFLFAVYQLTTRYLLND
ncbi:hypothetical protein G9A89_001276 [Geosiphon pyriformis]|nr:hypothetical protein G9A89_001276 [Geosiphon pyriformis]